MKFNILYQFRDSLKESGLTKNTQKQYYNFVKKVLADVDFENPEDIPPGVIEQGIRELATKNDVSAAKRGFELFAECFPELSLPDKLGEISKDKYNYRKRRFKTLKREKLYRQINSERKERLRYSYRLMLATGMRVSEVAQLTRQDIEITENNIECYVKNTKSGVPATIVCQEAYLAERLPKLLSDMEDADKVFYSKHTIGKAAGKQGFECHDLRRVFGRNKYEELKPECGSHYETVGKVREHMRHSSCRTTLKYLRRKII